MGPLVTILTRTLGRPCLADAAASVAAQTYRPIEWLVIDAAGTGIAAPAAGDVEVRVVGTGKSMLRSPAGNFGFAQSRGARGMLLDDDDLLLPRAVELLSNALAGNPSARVAYGDVAVETESGIEYEYAFDYSELSLLSRNLFPPNALMFDLSLMRDEGVRFDEGIDYFDDWDLWLQASARTAFAHVRERTGIYRLLLSQSGVWTYGQPGSNPRIEDDLRTVRARYANRFEPLRRAYDAKKHEARALAAGGRLEQAAGAWLAAHVMLPFDEEPVVGYATIALRAGDEPAALRTLVSALARAPGSEAYARMIAAILVRQGNEAGAREVMAQAARSRAPADATAQPSRGRPPGA